MSWNMKDYPVSMKNLDHLVRKKAIDIGNALLTDGYPEDRAIPIAISQAKKWVEDADESEKRQFKEAENPQKGDFHEKDRNAEELLSADVLVRFSEDQWQVISEGAERASDRFDTKDEAVKRAKKIAENKGTAVKIYKKDGTLQK
ncbi:DUF2188 domain-containing protein [Enterococcus massiliensis]|uniref:DUF2188 domain-containing protein n=1 Tax=Enterococcus massiliensis TaxID=1640685 RepID=UPI00065E4CFD|nr:DUF2188 domain-containing protein [Enterococcus massiliensis]